MESDEIGKKRIYSMQQELKTRGVAAMICMKPENSFYLSGFNPIIYSHPVVAVLPATGNPVILVHALRDDHAHESSWVRDIRLYGTWGVKKTMGHDWIVALVNILEELDVAKGPIGIEEDYLPLSVLRKFETAFSGASFENVSDVVRKARLIKEKSEIENLRISAKLADEGMVAAISALASGADDRGASVAAMSAMNRLWTYDYPDVEVCDFGSLEGGAHNGLWCWTLSGGRLLINTDNPKKIKPQPGELAAVFIWTVCNGMHVEIERSVAIGPLNDDHRKVYNAILEVRQNIRGMMKPGVAVKNFYLAAKEEYVRLGYGANMPGRIGHGMGLGAHEAPSIDVNSDIILEPNMVITFEPNVRIPEWGGIQHSDTVLITEDGCEFLTKTDNGYIQV